MKFKLKDAKQFGGKGLKGWAHNSKEDFPRASAACFEVDGAHGKVKTALSDTVYYVLEGKGEFIINEETMPVETTDVVIVAKNTPYNYRGKMKLFLVHTPAFDPKYEIELEGNRGLNNF